MQDSELMQAAADVRARRAAALLELASIGGTLEDAKRVIAASLRGDDPAEVVDCVRWGIWAGLEAAYVAS